MIVDVPILDDTVTKESDIYFFVNIIFNTDTIAQSVVTIVNDDHGKFNSVIIICRPIAIVVLSYVCNFQKDKKVK